MHVTSTIKGQTAEEAHVVVVPFGTVGFPFHTDDCCVVFDVGWEGQAHTIDRTIDDAFDKEGEEFAYQRLRFLGYVS